MKRRISSGTELLRLQRQIDELLEMLSASSRRGEGEFEPAVDIVEAPDSYTVRLDVPGAARASLEIQIRGRELHVSGVKQRPGCGGERRYHHMERSFGAFAVEVALPGPVRPDQSRARLTSGVLEITLPRVSDRRNTTYTIQLLDEEP